MAFDHHHQTAVGAEIDYVDYSRVSLVHPGGSGLQADPALRVRIWVAVAEISVIGVVTRVNDPSPDSAGDLDAVVVDANTDGLEWH